MPSSILLVKKKLIREEKERKKREGDCYIDIRIFLF
jgi:hypothetical protein